MPTTKKYMAKDMLLDQAAAFFAQQTDSFFLALLGEQEYRLSLLELGLA